MTEKKSMMSKKSQSDEGRVSLNPLNLKDALAGLLAVKPPSDARPKRQKKRKLRRDAKE